MNITTVTKLYTLFQNKRWTDKDGNLIVYENFCQLLDNLTDEQRELIIELAERYTWITFAEYHAKITNALNQVEDGKLKNLKKVFLFPIMKPEDEAKTKSGHTILYMVRAFKPQLLKYKHITFVELEKFESLSADKFSIKDDESIFLLDDYLGSGETINATLTEIMKNRKIEIKHLNIISIASQSDTLDSIVNLGIPVYADYISQKGISDYYKGEILEEKKRIMLEIEKLIPGNNHFSFGYNQSEALITLARTPDNTFPIFWKEYKKNNQKFEAPFSRY